MSKKTVVHSTFVIERIYHAAPSRVFAAWSSREAKGRWFVGPDEWIKSEHQLDFRVGGKESVSGGAQGETVHTYQARYMDIVPNVRIVTTYEMYMDDKRTSVSVATVEFEPAGPDGKSTRLTMTEQGAFLDGGDDVGSREAGTKALLDKLGASLSQTEKS